MNDLPARCFADRLVDLGERDALLRGILAPALLDAAPARGVTSQFLEHAADYAERYGNVAHFRVMLDDALARLDPPIAPEVILDIGSGSGNSVIPLLDRFPSAFVVATDISPQLLAILRDHLASQPRYAGRYALVCVDACTARYRAGAFDLAVGAAILHHVLEPERVIDACGRALAPGGAAVFFEPFEMGHAVLQLAYGHILEEAERRRDAAPGFAMLRRLHGDYTTRRTDRADPRFLDLDDKWMFTRTFFADAARHGRWAECIVYPTHAIDTPLRDQTRVNLRLGMGLDEAALPPWAWERLAAFERAFSAQALRELMFEGAIVMRTSPSALPAPGRAGWWFESSAPGRGFFVELREGRASVVCCHYDDAAAPLWHVAGPALLRDGRMSTTTRPGKLPFSLVLDGEDRAIVEWAGHRIALEPQHPGSPGWRGTSASGIGGTWREDAGQASVGAAVEELDARVFAALLTDDGWYMSVATRRRADAYAGQWLRFTGGQPLGGAYRAPAAPAQAGDARILRTETDRLVVQMPDGTHRVLRRGTM